jgi:hypothetical protein
MLTVMVASLPLPSTTMPTTLTLIDLALVLPWIRIGRMRGGHTVTGLIHCCHGCCCWRQPCLHLQDDSAKDNCHGDRQGHHTNICSREEVGQHDPIGVEKQKQKQKQKQKHVQQCGSNVTASMSVDSYAHAATAAASAEAETAAAAAQGWRWQQQQQISSGSGDSKLF